MDTHKRRNKAQHILGMLHTLVWSLALQLESGNHIDLWSYPNQDVGDCVTLLIGPLICSYPAFLVFNFVTNCTFMQETSTPGSLVHLVFITNAPMDFSVFPHQNVTTKNTQRNTHSNT